ncbi:LysM peptidoglycan-binding domain-containing protein [Caldicoprobacter faecalis]|uniref:LysM domain-containing protein n=1 Tax=Caldicoprobacter faecalis TaxID=937334 RepID=A0A1I5RS79_9FIRM|nr:LysM peptidoglycan-binding domain-containing protein [Caldicoprobacter faecalis]SFP61372.1 LysM domain-containing protein [Caldicoprobacter faecalis]
MPRQIRIKSKTRFCIFLTVFIALFISLIAAVWNGGKAASDVDWIEVEVVEGETLWHIAQRTLPPRTDIREYIRQIREANQLESCNIRVGQKLFIPIKGGF